MPNKYQKPVAELQNNRPDRVNRRTLQVVNADTQRPTPPLPKGLEPGARKVWRAVWSSQMAAHLDPATDGEALRRWIECVSERERLQPLTKKQPLVKGSTGQLTANPLFAVIAGLSKEIMHYEEAFGLTAIARMRLGIATVQHAASVHDLTARLERRQDRPQVIEAEVIDLDGVG